MDIDPALQASDEYPYKEGRLSMTDEELRLMERNRVVTRRIMVPLMVFMGAGGLVGGIWMMATDTLIIGMGTTFSALIMLGFAWSYAADTKKPVERPEKFFVTGIVTGKRKRGSSFNQVYYQLNLNGDKYTCYIPKKDFEKLKPGDIVQCERLEENSIDVDRVVVMGTSNGV